MNHYEILEVSPKASPEVIKAAYKSLMQRYHPDRNPGDAGVAERAMLISKAYEVLSDADKRASYDLELLKPATRAFVPASMRTQPSYVQEQEKPASSFGRWLLVALVAVLFGVFVWPRFGKHKAVETVPQAAHSPFDIRQPAAEQPQNQAKHDEQAPQDVSATPKKDAAAPAADDQGVKTITGYIENFTVRLKPAEGSASLDEHSLTIVTLSVTVGAFDSEQFVRYLKDNKSTISSKLADKLAEANYEKLGKAGSGGYLRELILNAIVDITGTDRTREYPGAGGGTVRYGVVDVALPDSFRVE